VSEHESFMYSKKNCATLGVLLFGLCCVNDMEQKPRKIKKDIEPTHTMDYKLQTIEFFCS